MKKKPFWNKKWGNDKICAITRTRIRPGKDKNGISYAIHLSCGHYFYRKAFIEWYAKNNDKICPLCRKNIDENDLK